MAVVNKCWHCKNIIDNKEDLITEKINNVNRKFHKSLGCLNKFKTKKEEELKAQKNKERINEGWSELYEYVKKDILKYPSNMQLSNHARNSLQQLRSGGLVRNHCRITDNGYPYPIILMTFKVKKLDIDRALDIKSFENENQKFNYIMAIIKNSINDVYMRILAKEKKEERIRNIVEVSVRPTKNVEYIKKSQIKDKGSLFDDVW